MTLRGIAIGLVLSATLWTEAPRAVNVDEGTMDGEGLIPVQASDQKAVQESVGIRILALRLKSANSLLDLRFRVVHSEKAAALFDRDRPHMIHLATGTKLHVTGPAAARLETDGIYDLLFANSNRKVKHGHLVTILVGDYRIQNIPVFPAVDPAVF
jgi:hypothetical protein